MSSGYLYTGKKTYKHTVYDPIYKVIFLKEEPGSSFTVGSEYSVKNYFNDWQYIALNDNDDWQIMNKYYFGTKEEWRNLQIEKIIE